MYLESVASLMAQKRFVSSDVCTSQDIFAPNHCLCKERSTCMKFDDDANNVEDSGVAYDSDGGRCAIAMDG